MIVEGRRGEEEEEEEQQQQQQQEEEEEEEEAGEGIDGGSGRENRLTLKIELWRALSQKFFFQAKMRAKEFWLWGD